MYLDLLLVTVPVVANLSVGLLVFLRNARAHTNLYFVVLTVNLSLWAFSNYYTEAATSLFLNSLFNRLAYLFGYLSVVSIMLFCYSFPADYSFKSLKKLILFWVAVVAFGIFSLTDLVAGVVTRDESGLKFGVGALIAPYAIVLLSLMIASVIRMRKVVKSDNVKASNQIRFIAFGFFFGVSLGVLANVIIPLVTADYGTAKFGPLLTLTIVTSVAYAIVRHGLFDIRPIIARSVAYVLTFITIGLIFGGALFGLSNLLTTHFNETTTQIFFVAATPFSAIAYLNLKKNFDKLTNRIFYQDAYDPQAFLDSLNKVMVTSVELTPLTEKVTNIIANTFKIEFCVFGIMDDNQRLTRVTGTPIGMFANADMSGLCSQVSRVNRRQVVADNLSDEFVDVTAEMSKLDVAVFSKLSYSRQVDCGGSGCLLLGRKRSGSSYSRQDIRVLELISDELIIAIQNSMRFEEIKNFNTTLQETVEKATREIRRSNEKLKALDKTKDDFISMASHQLRTPLTSVKGYLSLVIEGDAGKITPMQHRLLEQAYISSQRMVFLIADLLNVSRLKNGKLVIDHGPTDMIELIQSELTQLKDIAKSRGLKLTFDKPKKFPIMMLDDPKIRQVVMNFVDNAIYYTASGGHIRVELHDNPRSIECLVIDNGIGVPRKEQPSLFTKFYRAGNARQARPDGTGLGLYMAKKVVTAQNGAIIFRSREGEGSTFGFSFPKARLAEPTEPDKLPVYLTE